MVQRATSMSGSVTEGAARDRLAAAFAAARAEHEVPEEFGEDVLAEVRSALADPDLPETDATDLPFITIDPPGSMDLDQAMHIARREEGGYRVRYAIADVPAFVTPGGALDAEVHRRGQTVYCPDTRVPLHPAELSEGAASLLPDEIRPAYVWDMLLTDEGVRDGATLSRALVRSVRRYDYAEVQQLVDAGEAEETLILLKEVGELRIARELARGGASLPMPQQEVHRDEDGYHLRLRPLLPSEDWNAQISLLAGMVAGRMMLEGGIGILRTMPEPDDAAVARFRREARALGTPWPKDRTYGEYLRDLDREDPRHLAIIHAATALFRGAAYTAFDGDLPDEEEQIQAAIASPYAHVTAPLRRLVDRFGLVVCEALSAGREVPEWVRSALPELPEIMATTDRRARAVDRDCVAAVEAAVLEDRVGDTFEATVVEELERGDVRVQLLDPPVSEIAEGRAEAGTEVTVRVEEAEIASGTVRLSVVSGAEGEET